MGDCFNYETLHKSKTKRKNKANSLIYLSLFSLKTLSIVLYERKNATSNQVNSCKNKLLGQDIFLKTLPLFTTAADAH